MIIANPATSRSSTWTRFWRLAQIEENIALGAEEWQDQRIANVEPELRSLKQQLAHLQRKRNEPV